MANDVKIRLAVDGTAQAQDQLNSLESRLGVLNGTLVKTAHYGTALAGAFGLAIPALSNTVRATISAADAVTTLQNQLKLATGSAADAGQAYTALFAIAQKSRVSFTELGSTFASISRAGQELGISQSRLLTVTQSIGNAMAISGGSAQGMQAALLQLGQGLSSGTLRGEELNSVMEQSPRLAKALAEGLGVPLGELRKLGEAGQLTSEQVINALEKAGPQLAKEIETSVMTVGQAMTVLGNAATKFVGEMDQATNASSNLAAGIKGIASAIEGASTSGSISFLTSDFKAAGEAMDRAKLQGAGFWGQMNQGAGMLIGRTVGLGLINRDFMTLSSAVADATATIRRLDEQEQRTGKLSIYSMSERAAAARDLARANRELAQSKNEAVVSSTQQGIEAGGKAREKYLAGQAKDMADLNALRNKLDGVPESYIKDMAEIIRLNQAGVLVGKEYTDILAKQQATLLKKTGATQSESTALTEAAKGLALYGDLISKAAGYNSDYAEKVAKLSAAFASNGLNVDQLQQAMKQLNSEQQINKDAAKKWEDQIKANSKAAEDYAKSQNAAFEAVAKDLESLEKSNTALALQNETIGLSTEALNTLILSRQDTAIAALEMVVADQAADNALGIANGTLQGQIDLLKELKRQRELTATGQVKTVAVTTAKEAAAEWKKTSDSINSTLTDALMRGFESGKGFAKTMRDTVVNMFKTMVLRPIISAVMNPIAGAIGGAMGLSGAANAASGGANAIGTAANMYSFGSTLATVGSQVAASTMSLANATGTLFANATGSGISGLLATNGAYGTAAASAGGSAMSSIATAAPYALAAVAALAAFGAFRTTKQTGTGISGTLGDDASLTGFNEMRKSGYLFGGPKYWDEIKAIDPLMAKALKADFTAIKAAATGAADALGLASDSVAGFNKAFRIEFTGDKAKDEALYKDLMAGVSEDLAKTILGSYKETIATVIDQIATSDGTGEGGNWTYSKVDRQVKTSTYTPSEFARDGETASQTLARLAQSITLVNGTSDLLGNSLFDVGLKGANTASLIIDAFGGAEAYAQSMGSYYTNFYRQSEQTAKLTETTAAAFTALGKTMPVLDESARDVYRGMVEAAAGMDMTVESNRTAYASLLALQGPMNQLAPAFDDVTTAVKAANEALTKTNQGWQDQLDVLTGAQTDRSLALRDTTDASTRALMRQVYAQQDLKAATDSTVASYNSIMSAAQSIRDRVSGVSGSVSDSIFGMQYGLADNPGKYNMLDVRGATLNNQMRSSTDIYAIAGIADSLISNLNQAWGLLDPAQQQAQILPFEEKLTAISDFVTNKGADPVALAKAQAAETARTIAAAVKEAIEEAMKDPTSALSKAAADVKAAASIPAQVISNVNVTVTAPAGSEVSIA